MVHEFNVYDLILAIAGVGGSIYQHADEPRFTQVFDQLLFLFIVDVDEKAREKQIE